MKREPQIVEFKQSWHDEYLKHGVCHDCSGSTKQELTGIALQQFILKKMGRTWDDVGNERATIEDIDCVAIDYFPREVDETSFADISCGLGTFLQEAFQFVVDCATRWYEQNAPAHLEEGAHGEKRLPFTDRDLPLVVGAT